MPCSMPQGKMLRLYGMTMDVTERKEAEAALQTAHIRAINEKNRLEAVMADLAGGCVHFRRAGR